MKFDHQNSENWCPPELTSLLSSPLVRAWEHGHLLQLTGGGHEIFDLTNFASHVCPSGEFVSCVISLSSPNFHTNSLYFNHSSPYKLLYYAWVTCDYISRKISPWNWFQCFPVYPRCCSGSDSGSGSGSGSGFPGFPYALSIVSEILLIKTSENAPSHVHVKQFTFLLPSANTSESLKQFCCKFNRKTGQTFENKLIYFIFDLCLHLRVF